MISLLQQQSMAWQCNQLQGKIISIELKNNHQNLTVEETGLFVSKDIPFLGTSPDVLVH